MADKFNPKTSKPYQQTVSYEIYSPQCMYGKNLDAMAATPWNRKRDPNSVRSEIISTFSQTLSPIEYNSLLSAFDDWSKKFTTSSYSKNNGWVYDVTPSGMQEFSKWNSKHVQSLNLCNRFPGKIVTETRTIVPKVVKN